MKRNFERYCDNFENIENYEAAKRDNFKGWLCHHRLETHNSDGERRPVDIPRKELKALDMYFHRPPEELIFLTVKEHHILHNKGRDIICIETGEIHHYSAWVSLGYTNASEVARGKCKTCKGLHFEYIN